MARYTAYDDPALTRLITRHLERIVAAVRAHLEPQAIILYGSFGRGEGSVLLTPTGPLFLSDYEIAVVTRSPFYRGLFAALSRELTAELGVEVSLSWLRPGRLRTNQPQNLALGKARPTIAMYELKAGGRTLYGRDMLALGPVLDPRTIPVRAGIRLLINRITETLPRYTTGETGPPPVDEVRWLNKLILAAAESLLLLWGEYHYSYAERGRRFARRAAADARWQTVSLPQLAARATRFKLRPDLSLYPEERTRLWERVLRAVDAVFRHLMAEELGIAFDSYTRFPERFLSSPRVRREYNLYRLWPLPRPYDQKLVNALKYLRQRRLPPAGYWTHPTVTANLIVFAVAPVLLLGPRETPLPAVHEAARRWLALLGYRGAPEGEALRRYLLWAWRNFCYN